MNTSDDDQKTTSSDTPLQKQSASEEAKDAIINVLRDAGVQDAIYIVQSINDFLRNVGREASRKRQQQYVEPFKCDDSDVEDFDNTVKQVLIDASVASEKIFFDCNIGLRNNRVITCRSIEEVKHPPEADKSWPASLEMNWTYFYQIRWRELSIPMPFKVVVEYSTEVRRDIVGAMAFVVAPEQYIDVAVEGPPLIVSALNDQLDAVVRRTFIPIWWRYPKKALQWLEPYIGFAIYGAAVSTAFMTAQKLVIQENKTELQRRVEYRALREKALKEYQDANQKKNDILQQILSTTNTADKIDAYASYILRTDDPPKLKSEEEFIKSDSILPYIGFIFLCFVGAGLLHIAFTQVYKRLAPPSIIVLGKLGHARRNLWQLYNAFAWLLVTLVAVPIYLLIKQGIEWLYTL